MITLILKEEQYEAVWTVVVHEEHRSLFCLVFFLKDFGKLFICQHLPFVLAGFICIFSRAVRFLVRD